MIAGTANWARHAVFQPLSEDAGLRRNELIFACGFIFLRATMAGLRIQQPFARAVADMAAEGEALPPTSHP